MKRRGTIPLEAFFRNDKLWEGDKNGIEGGIVRRSPGFNGWGDHSRLVFIVIGKKCRALTGVEEQSRFIVLSSHPGRSRGKYGYEYSS